MAALCEVVRVEDVAPPILVYVILSGDDCHWKVTPEPKVVIFCNDKVKLLPEQTGFTDDRVLPGTGVPAQGAGTTTVIL